MDQQPIFSFFKNLYTCAKLVIENLNKSKSKPLFSKRGRYFHQTLSFEIRKRLLKIKSCLFFKVRLSKKWPLLFVLFSGHAEYICKKHTIAEVLYEWLLKRYFSNCFPEPSVLSLKRCIFTSAYFMKTKFK